MTTKTVADVDPQLEMQLPEVYKHRLLMARKLEAARKLVAERTLKVVAEELDKIWGDLGHPVSASTVSNTLRDHERSYWRSEWDSWFCDNSDEFREVCAEMAHCGKRRRTLEERHEALIDQMREELSHKKVTQMLRKAEGL